MITKYQKAILAALELQERIDDSNTIPHAGKKGWNGYDNIAMSIEDLSRKYDISEDYIRQSRHILKSDSRSAAAVLVGSISLNASKILSPSEVQERLELGDLVHAAKVVKDATKRRDDLIQRIGCTEIDVRGIALLTELGVDEVEKIINCTPD